jgi:hypothetical protein
MSDGAAEAAEQDEGVLRRVLQLGAAGRGRAEIAAALGMSPTVLMARESQDAALAASLGEAAALSQAWWEAMAREACEAGRFNLAACTREMRRRFGEGGATAEPKPAPEAALMPAPAEDWKAGEEPFPTKPRPGERAIFLYPCNGRMKKGPDGKCRCGGYHNDAYWAARAEAYYAEHPDARPDPELDEDDDDDDGPWDLSDDDDVLEDEQ